MSKSRQVLTLSEAFDLTLKHFNLRASAIADASGASAAQISQFKNGRRNLSTAQLERVLSSMNELAPGSRAYFYLLAAGPLEHKQVSMLLNLVADSLETTTNHLPPLELALQ